MIPGQKKPLSEFMSFIWISSLSALSSARVPFQAMIRCRSENSEIKRSIKGTVIGWLSKKTRHSRKKDFGKKLWFNPFPTGLPGLDEQPGCANLHNLYLLVILGLWLAWGVSVSVSQICGIKKGNAYLYNVQYTMYIVYVPILAKLYIAQFILLQSIARFLDLARSREI